MVRGRGGDGDVRPRLDAFEPTLCRLLEGTGEADLLGDPVRLGGIIGGDSKAGSALPNATNLAAVLQKKSNFDEFFCVVLLFFVMFCQEVSVGMGWTVSR
jgi:hypothetical protein